MPRGLGKPTHLARFLLYDERRHVPIRVISTTARIKSTGLIMAGNGGYYCPVSGKKISQIIAPHGPSLRLLQVRDLSGRVTHDFMDVNGNRALVAEARERRLKLETA